MPYDITLGRILLTKKFFEQRISLSWKGVCKMGQYTSLSNKILMDIIRSHVS